MGAIGKFAAQEGARGFSRYIDDRPDDGVFRVDRAIHADRAVFEAEMAAIFEGGWVYLCHESQIARPGDFFTTSMGRQPVFVMRQKDGGIKGFINACAHRAALLTASRQGNARVLTCRFHGWAYDLAGRCIKIKNEDTGFAAEGFDRARFNLTGVARVTSYRGFVFGSLNRRVPDLVDYLGGAATWIDLMVEQSPDGLEVVPGYSSYRIRGNWKLQAENSVDGYHVSSVHRVFAATMVARESRGGYLGMRKTEAGRITGDVASGGYDLGHGHIAIWARHTTPEVRPIYRWKDRLAARLPAERLDWILARGRNLCLFPNVMLMDNPSTQIRVMQPLAPDLTEVTVYCIAPVGEEAEARRARLRKFEDFYLTTGMATSDDVAALEDTQEGGNGRAARWNDLCRGMADMTHGPDADARAIGMAAVTSSPNWDHETLFHGFYRHWQEMMDEGSGQE
jgi:benzoate/toluate 1,2-dioxygenase subunit alpha